MSTQNAKSALINLAECASLSMRSFAFGDAPDQDTQSPTIDRAQRAVKTMPPTLRASFERIDISGGGVSNRHDSPSLGRLGLFPFQLEGMP